jgi:hypothetical protein
MPTAARPGNVEQAPLEQFPGEHSLVERCIDRDHRRREGETASQIERRPRDVGDLDTPHGRDLVVPQASDVAPERAGGLTGRRRASRDVHLAEGGTPERQTEEHCR